LGGPLLLIQDASPYVADNFGRKVAIITGCLFMILGGLLGAFSNGYNMYIASRIILGFGNALSQMASPMLLTEICHPQHRGPVTTIYNCLWNVGALRKYCPLHKSLAIIAQDADFWGLSVVSCIGWGTSYVPGDWSWRSITFIQIVPSVIQLIGIWCK
jgi:MFS family permease